MKQQLRLKLITCYLIFAALAILLLSTLTQHMTDQFLRENEAQQMYREATLIASDLKDVFDVDSNRLQEMEQSLK